MNDCRVYPLFAAKSDNATTPAGLRELKNAVRLLLQLNKPVNDQAALHITARLSALKIGYVIVAITHVTHNSP